MQKIYKTTNAYPSTEIKEYSLVRQTEHKVWFFIMDGVERCENKVTEFYRFHETRDAAVAFLVAKYEAQIKQCEEKIAAAKIFIEKLSTNPQQ